MSVQSAESIVFEDGCFDYIIGSSALHHFDNVEGFLRDCRRVLKLGGAATFGEPFAVGYALGAAFLTIAQKQLGTEHAAINSLYRDISDRMKGSKEFLSRLVDKHLFLQSSFLEMARRAGFSGVDFVPLASRDYYRDYFIRELFLERGGSDPRLVEVANEMYKVAFDLFDTDSFGHSIAAFIQVVLRV